MSEALIERRRARRRQLVERVRAFADGILPSARVRAVVVFGSVARGDFNDRSDIDVLVIAADLPHDPMARLGRLGVDLPPSMQVVAWTLTEWRYQRGRGNPIAEEACERGVWLVGAAADLCEDDPQERDA